MIPPFPPLVGSKLVLTVNSQDGGGVGWGGVGWGGVGRGRKARRLLKNLFPLEWHFWLVRRDDIDKFDK